MSIYNKNNKNLIRKRPGKQKNPANCTGRFAAGAKCDKGSSLRPLDKLIFTEHTRQKA